MGLEQIWLFEKLTKRFKMKPIRTSIEVIFLLGIGIAIFSGAGFLAEKGRQFASNADKTRIVIMTIRTIGILGLFGIGFIITRNFLFPKYIWNEELKAFRNPKTNKLLCSNCKGKIILEKDKIGLFRICPKCGMVQEPSLEEQKKALRDIVLTTAPHRKKVIRVSILTK